MNYYRSGQHRWRSAPWALRGVALLRRLMLATTTKHQLQLIACAFNASSAPPVCEGKQPAMEADERAYNNIVAPLSRNQSNGLAVSSSGFISASANAWLSVALASMTFVRCSIHSSSVIGRSLIR